MKNSIPDHAKTNYKTSLFMKLVMVQLNYRNKAMKCISQKKT